MLEMPISDEDMTMKSGSMGPPISRGLGQGGGGRMIPGAGDYRSYGREPSVAYEGDFSMEESMYAINVPGRMDPLTK